MALAGGAGAIAGGAIAGAVTGYLQDQGVDAEVAEEYARDIEADGALVAVEVPSGNVDVAKAHEVMEKYGGRNIHVQELVAAGV